MPLRMPPCMPSRMPLRMPPRMPLSMPPRMPLRMPLCMPVRVPLHMLLCMPVRTHVHMPLRMPLPITLFMPLPMHLKVAPCVPQARQMPTTVPSPHCATAECPTTSTSYASTNYSTHARGIASALRTILPYGTTEWHYVCDDAAPWTRCLCAMPVCDAFAMCSHGVYLTLACAV